MKTCTKCMTEKPRGEFHANKRRKDGLNHWCRECTAGYKALYYAANVDRIKEYNAGRYAANAAPTKSRQAAYRAANAEKIKEYKSAWQKENRKSCTARQAAWRRENPEKASARHAAWRKANSSRVNAWTSARYARKLKATPGWADKRGIEMWYTGAKIMTQLVGKPYHVDHVVPLKSKLVCGLHVPANMQILPGADNSAKGNRYWPDMP